QYDQWAGLVQHRMHRRVAAHVHVDAYNAGLRLATVAAGNRRDLIDPVQLQAVAVEQVGRVGEADLVHQQYLVWCGRGLDGHVGSLRYVGADRVQACGCRRSMPGIAPPARSARCAPRAASIPGPGKSDPAATDSRRTGCVDQAVAERPSGSATEISSTSCSPSLTRSTLTASTSTLTYLRITSSSSRCNSGR